MKTRLQLALVGVCAIALAAGPAGATPQPAPPGGPIEAFAAHDPDSTKYRSHRLWAAILKTLYGEANSFGNYELDYGALDRSGQKTLRSYLKTLEATDVMALGREEQLAFWLNFYNAATVAFTLEEFVRVNRRQSSMAGRNPHRQARVKIKRFYLDDDSPWTEKKFAVNGVALSLNDIEHRILYAHWDTPLVMYGLTCPAKGCPELPREPFTGPKVYNQLAAAARAFLAEEDNLEISGRTADLSKLYQWHAGLFDGQAGLVAHLTEFAGHGAAAISKIDDYDFEWGLRGKAPDPSWSMPMGPINRGTNPGFGVQ